jgi:putative intracellular protease/amidase
MKTIAVMVESHYDPTEPGAFSMYFPANGYQVEFISDLRGGAARTFKDNDGLDSVTVTRDIRSVELAKYAGLVLVGGYAMDMLRYEVFVDERKPNVPPASQFAADALLRPNLVVGTICHALWLLTPVPDVLRGRRVTCSHNIMHDVQNAGAVLVYDEARRMLADTHVDGNLVSARHPYVVQAFMDAFLGEIRKRQIKGGHA